MNEKYSSIPEIREADAKYRNLKRLTDKSRRKLRKLIEKYSFVESIVNQKCISTKLEEEIAKLFSSLGYKAICTYDNKDLDVYATIGGDKLGIEVKGEATLGENELFQIHKYAQRRKSEGLDFHPLLIWNNSRHNNNFSPNMDRDAKLNSFTLITTQELLKGYLKLQRGKMTLDIFRAMLKQYGVITYSNTQIQKFKEMESER